MAPRLLERFFGSPSTEVVATPEPEIKRLLPVVQDGPIGLDTKASSMALLPRGAYGTNYVFFSPDGGRTMFDISEGPTTLAFIAYWYVATRWRAQKIAEPPLMVVEEDQKTGDEEWLDDHELVSVLEEPSPDYDMGELIETISHYLDNSGACLVVMDKDNAGRVSRLTPFSRNEFEPHRDDTRLFASFTIQTADGPEDRDAEDCIFFRDFHGSSGAWSKGKSRLDVAISWLKLGARAQQTIHDLLANSVWPSVAITPDKDWDPDPETYKLYTQDIKSYAKAGNKGKPFVALGGGTITPLQTSIKDLVPDEILGRVESIVSAITGVPAIVLQFQIGMENSPWSQMAQARKMAYDDCVQPSWRKMERTFTKQMLRGVDDDTTHFIRFDSSNVAALQQDQLVQVQIATGMGRAASLNERRAVMGLEPIKNNPKADEIPELVQPSFAELLAGGGGKDPNADSQDPKKPKDEVPSEDTAKQKARRLWLERKFKTAALQDAFREESIPAYTVVALNALKHDADRIAEIVHLTLLDVGEGKGLQTKARGKDKVMSAVSKYLSEDGRKHWTRAMQPINTRAAERSGAVIASDMNINFSLLHGNLLTYARKQTGKMVTDVNATTKSLVSDIIQGGLDANASTKQIANLIREATGFDQARADLIARTESTKAFNGAPTESLVMLSEGTGRTFTKTWSGVLDDKERDEHLAMEGETVSISDEFSNGLQYPSEPNCRCTVLFDETSED
jgi:SPP1 gp7 family putative phage head morphogenesis protein